MRFVAYLFALLALVQGQIAAAQQWTTSERTPTWSASPVIGDGVDRHPEVSTSAQGGDPPALAYEPAAIDENGLYTRTQWFGGTPNYNTSATSPKARFTCNGTHFGLDDPIVNFGVDAAHYHKFVGNKSTNRDSTYTTLRNNPASACAGGPTNATGYWVTALMYEIEPGVFVPVWSNSVTFYYTINNTTMSPALYRLLRGLAFIGGVDPADRLNTERLNEIPDGAGWLKTRRYNGWNGWGCYSGSTHIPPAVGNTADQNSQSGFVRQLVNEDGSDPWDGACEGADKKLIASMSAPSCWDGYNLTSPDGRDHFRYPIFQASNQTPSAEICPTGWWKVPHFEVKEVFPNGRAGGINGHAWRSKLHLTSDRMDPNPANWHPRGSTYHFDWMNGWDSVVIATWLNKCVGVAIDGAAGTTADCDDSTISSTQKLIVTGSSPDPSLSNDPVVTLHDYANAPSKDAFGPVEEGTEVDMTIEHNH